MSAGSEDRRHDRRSTEGDHELLKGDGRPGRLRGDADRGERVEGKEQPDQDPRLPLERDAHLDVTAAATRFHRSSGVDGPSLAFPDLEPAFMRESDELVLRLEDAERAPFREIDRRPEAFQGCLRRDANVERPSLSHRFGTLAVSFDVDDNPPREGSIDAVRLGSRERMRALPEIERYEHLSLRDIPAGAPRPLKVLWAAAEKELGSQYGDITVRELLDRFAGTSLH